eukprot:s116_g27.t1
MELVFLLTGWTYATEGKKCTAFGTKCKALGVEFGFSRSGERVLSIRNTEQRVQDLTAMISAVLEAGRLGKQDTLILRGKLGFADSFLHGRLGSLVLKQLADHAYGKTSRLSSDLKLALSMMQHRLAVGRPREVTAKRLETWYVYTDAAYEPETCSGGIGGALFSVAGQCLGWFGIVLDRDACNVFGASEKQTIIYELELCAAVLALDFWANKMKHGLQVCFGDNDGARFSLIRGSCVNACAAKLMKYHLQREADHNLCTWFARVPTEANISDYPSRGAAHPLLHSEFNESTEALAFFTNLMSVGPICRKGLRCNACILLWPIVENRR